MRNICVAGIDDPRRQWANGSDADWRLEFLKSFRFRLNRKDSRFVHSVVLSEAKPASTFAKKHSNVSLTRGLAVARIAADESCITTVTVFAGGLGLARRRRARMRLSRRQCGRGAESFEQSNGGAVLPEADFAHDHPEPVKASHSQFINVLKRLGDGLRCVVRLDVAVDFARRRFDFAMLAFQHQNWLSRSVMAR